MTPIKKDDFVELEYTAKIKGTGEVFDTTSEEIAKSEGLDAKKARFGPIIAKVGAHIVIVGLDDALIGKQVGKFVVDLPAEKAFGKKDARLVQLIATTKFTKQNINPMPGLQITIDNQVGTIKTVTGGRTIVDFNHPLSGKEVVYEVNLKRVVTDKKEQCKAAFEWMQFVPREWEVKDNLCTVMVEKEVPKDVQTAVSGELKRFTGVELVFKIRDQPKQESKLSESKQESQSSVPSRKKAEKTKSLNNKPASPA